MATYKTLEDIKATIQTSLFGDDGLIDLRPEQRDAINFAKERFCSKSGRKPNYEYNVLPEYRQFLWNAKMRFGKTICALQLAKEMDVKRTLIVTHRPVVGDSWLGAFRQVFGTKDNLPKVRGNSDLHKVYGFGARSDNENVGSFADLEKFVKTDGNHYVFFVSMQYLRLSELVNAKTLAKNKEKEQEDLFGHSASRENEILKASILNTDWDLVVIDEAHEGTRTALGESVIKNFLKKEKTKMLHLSGTPFNLYEDFKEEEIYTWDYVSEQQAKLNWERVHPGEKNPYEDLPKMNIFTYDITKNIDQVLDQNGLFSFTEFFRIWTGNPKQDNPNGEGPLMPEGAKGRFVHEDEVNKFLDLLCTKDSENNFPFSTDEYRKMFRHTLWVVPPLISVAKALEELLNNHPKFKNRFKIINVAGNVDTDEQKENALDVVNKTIGELPEKTATITISCGRLTTGVTVEPWTAVFYLKGGDRAATYMQTIFRVQSPYKTNDGRMKTSCYVFDFAPDRTLKIVAETAKFSSMAKAKEKKEEEGEEEKTQEMRDRETVQDFIELCPVISMAGGKMSPMDISDIYKQLENVFIDRLVRKGFDDPCLYVQEELNKVNPEILNQIGEHGGQAPDETRKEATKVVDLSHMTPEQRAAWEAMIAKKKAEAEQKAKKKAKKDEAFKEWWNNASDEDREKWLQEEAEKAAKREKAKEEREEFKKRITNIRGIALRIPLLMYGGADAGDSNDDITVSNFTRKIKDESWVEFMPKGITKDDFNKIKNCFNATRFMEAGKKYRALTREADFVHVEERIKQITEIFSYFRNPDKETVLTPWRAVNMHMSETLGGWCFFDDTFDEEKGQLDSPHYVDQGEVTQLLFDNVDMSGEVQTKILEINSKTGLYPLYITYSLYRRRLEEYIKAECIDPNTVSVQEEQVVWDDIVKDNLFVICNTPMAVGITRRTLFGFRGVERKANIKSLKLIEEATTNQDSLINNLKCEGFWKGNRSNNMIEFNAVVGNPPYQGSARVQLYPTFYKLSQQLGKISTLIFPTGWQKPCAPTAKGLFKLNNEETKADRQIVFIDNKHDVFPGISGASEINVILWRKNYNNGFDGKQMVYTDGKNPQLIQLQWVQTGDGKPFEIKQLAEKVKNKEGVFFKSMSDCVSAKDPYGIPTDIFSKPDKYGRIIDDFHIEKQNEDDIRIYGGIEHKRAERYVSKGFPMKDNSTVGKFKIFVPWAWGNMDENAGLGGAYADIIIAEPNDVCSMTYNVCGEYDDYETAKKQAKYMMTTFFRGLMFMNKDVKTSSRTAYSYVPVQDFSEEWWNNSIEDIDNHLFDKYDALELIDFMLDSIQTKSEDNIINYR
jgi:hypothetical protein